MRSQASAGRRQQQQPPLAASEEGRSSAGHPGPRKLQPGSGTPWGLLFCLLAFWVSSCKGAPMASHVLQGEQDSQLLNESSNALEDLCFMVLELLQKAQEVDEKDINKRFLFHYSKTHDTGNSNVLDELRIPGGIQSRGYFIFRPRNGRRSATYP